MNDFENNNPAEPGQDESYNSVNSAQIEAAKAAGNVWNFEGREMEMFVARGYIESATDILNPSTGEETGAIMIHKFGWQKSSPFIAREQAFKTSLRRVGRNTKQNVKTTQLVPVNAELYTQLIQGGIIRRFENGEPVDIEKSREDMLEFARIYPEGASEAIETWFDSATIELLDEKLDNNFDWIFQNYPVKRVLWFLGSRENPAAAGILTFRAPTAEEREKFDEEVQNIDSDKKGDVNFAELSENFTKKVQYGAKYLQSVEGIAVGSEGVVFNPKNNDDKENFITLFNPVWFADAVETMHESFNFMKGKSAKS